MTTYEKLTRLLQLVVAVAAFVSLYLVLRQVWIMNDQIEATRQASEAQSVISLVQFLQSNEAR